MMHTSPTLVAVLLLLTACSVPAPQPSDQIVVSIVGTNDVHGELLPRNGSGGLTTLSGYVDALRAARHRDGGSVLLIDAGDMWQGTLESNLNEGQSVVTAYNALGYTAAALGNHEFDFGPSGPDVTASNGRDDPRGALKQRATEARFPLLAANLIDQSTGRAVNWANVQPSTLVETSGIKVGIIGVMTKDALRATIAANVTGLEIAPLAPAIEQQARALRAAGAALIVVSAHAGGRCTDFEDPEDLSSCSESEEIFEVAQALPRGLVDHIIAGHVHHGIAHVVNGTSISASFSNTLAFGRVDFFVSRNGDVVDRKIFPPQRLLAGAVYEGQPVTSDPAVVAIVGQAVQAARAQKQRQVGIRLETPFTLEGNPESPLGNLFTDALLESFDADIAIHNVSGGLRTDLRAGDLTFGSVYELSPFENRVVIVDLSGAELRQIVASEAHRGSRSMGFSGMRVFIACAADVMSVRIVLDDGREVGDDDVVTVVINDYIALGGDGILSGVTLPNDIDIHSDMPATRDIVVRWLSERGGSIHASSFSTTNNRKWNRSTPLTANCRLE